MLYLRHKLIKVLKLFCSFSDEGEDKLLLQIFISRGIRKGTYLDIGAYHPWKVSNTFLLYLWGWSGTCVDICPKWKWRLYRPRDKYIYGYVDADSSYKFKNRMWTSDVKMAQMEMAGGFKPEVKMNIPKIEPNFKDYDLLDLDVDGIDFRILQKLLSVHRPKWILAEDKCFADQRNIYDYLTENGYKRIANTTRNGVYELI